MSWHTDILVRQAGGSLAIPAQCYAPCNTAFSIAQEEGRIPSLCNPGSAFRNALKACSACINEASSSSGGLTRTLPVPQFIDFCSLIEYSTGVFTLTDGKKTTLVYLSPAQSSAPPKTSVFFVTRTTVVIPSIPTSSNSRSVTSSTPISAGSSTAESSRVRPSSHVWIAGPVVGTIVGIAIIISVLLYIRKRRGQDRQDPTHDKAQLHSDSLPKPMLHGDTSGIHELDAFSMSPRTEMPANEVPAAELPIRDGVEAGVAFELSIAREVLAGPDVSDSEARQNDSITH